MAIEERQYRKQYQRKRRILRQRRVMLCLSGVLVVLLTAWNISSAIPRNTWLQLPPGYYRPELFAEYHLPQEEQLKPLPARYEDTVLRQKLEALLAEYPKNRFKPHVYFFNLQDYSYVNINGNDAVPAASVIKLPILLEYFMQVERGRLTPYTHLVYEHFQQAGGSGSLQYKTPGVPLLARDVASAMIQESDNTCTNMLIYHLGGADYLNERFKALGLKRTRINNWLPDLSGTNVVSMQDMATLLYNIDQGHPVDPASQAEAMAILKGTHNRGLLPALLPRGTTVAHKTGDIGTSLGNAGLVILPDGRKYIIAIQVERPFNDYGAKDLIQKASRLVYDNVTSQSTLAASTR